MYKKVGQSALNACSSQHQVQSRVSTSARSYTQPVMLQAWHQDCAAHACSDAFVKSKAFFCCPRLWSSTQQLLLSVACSSIVQAKFSRLKLH